jgi:hypothetical protein
VQPYHTFTWFYGSGMARGKIYRDIYSIERTQSCGTSATFYLALPNLPNPDLIPDPEPEEE